MTFPTLLGNSLIGFLLVFLVLIVLMAFIAVMNRIFSRKPQKEPQTAEQSEMPKEIPEVKLYNVSERDAAMVMAIVADESGIPLNELRFISIREVEE